MNPTRKFHRDRARRQQQARRRMVSAGSNTTGDTPEVQTFWNGESTPARVVRVIVGKARPGWWCSGLEGQERRAVEVRYGDQRFYLDNEDGSGWAKVTRGLGSPRYGHKSLPVARVLGEERGA